MSFLSRLLKSALSRRSGRRTRRLEIESLQQRWTPAVTAFFSPADGLLTVFGDSLDNSITVSRNPAGNLLVNNGAVAIVGGAATVANTVQIQMFGLGGNDTLSLNEANGALPAAILYGGGGNDQLTGGAGADQIFGQDGNDVLLGKGGIDLLFGGGANDTLTGGDGDDQAFGQSGNDRMIWNPGDDTDLNEGGQGADSVEVNGGNLTESFTVTPNGTRVRFDRIDPAPFSLDIGTTEALFLNANAGFDVVTASNGLSTLIELTLNGGAGNDTINGGDGNDRISGGDGNDFIDGNRGNDVIFAGAGNDVMPWDPGDGSDTLEGQDGADRMVFNGANIAESIEISANGSRVRFTRDIAGITMDLNDVESIDFNALAGADLIVINDLTGTDVTAVNLDLGVSAGAEGSVDTVTVKGTTNADVIGVSSSGTGVAVSGLAALVSIRNAEITDKLIASGQAGDDVIDATLLAAASMLFTADGDEGDDVLRGGAGDDTLRGGIGDDVLFGNAGNDILDGGEGDNFVVQ